MTKHHPPIFQGERFNCPYCGAFAQMTWYERITMRAESHSIGLNHIRTATCMSCRETSFWSANDRKMIFPSIYDSPLPSADMPDTVKAHYNEARQVAANSPRAAGALLRLAVQTLCNDLKAEGNSLNDQIGDLVRKGLPQKIQQALDLVRVIGTTPSTLDKLPWTTPAR